MYVYKVVVKVNLINERLRKSGGGGATCSKNYFVRIGNKQYQVKQYLIKLIPRSQTFSSAPTMVKMFSCRLVSIEISNVTNMVSPSFI